MTLSAGSVSVNGAGVVSGSGYARDLYAAESAGAGGILEGAVADAIAPALAQMTTSNTAAVDALVADRAAKRSRLAARVPTYEWQAAGLAEELAAFDAETSTKVRSLESSNSTAVATQRAQMTAGNIAARQDMATKCTGLAAANVALVLSATVTVTCPPGGGVVTGVVT